MYRLLDTFDVSDCCHSLARGDSSASRGLGKKEKQHKGLHVREGVGCGVLGHRHLRGKEPDWKGMPHHQDHQAAPHPAEAMGSERYVLSSTSHLLFVRYQVLGYLKCNIDDVIIKTRDGYRAPVLTGPGDELLKTVVPLRSNVNDLFIGNGDVKKIDVNDVCFLVSLLTVLQIYVYYYVHTCRKYRRQSVRMSVFLCIYLSVCLSVFLSVCLSFCL